MVAAAIVGGALIGGVATTVAGNKAAGAQEDAANSANQTQLAMYNQTRADQEPFRESGYNALAAINRGLGLGPPGDANMSAQPLSYDEWLLQFGGGPLPAAPPAGGGIGGAMDRAVYASRLSESQAAYNKYKTQFERDRAASGAVGYGDFTRDFSNEDFYTDPGYQFRLDEGGRAVDRSAAARGGLLSGRTLKELTRFGQGVASDEYGAAYARFNNNRTQRFNRLASVAGIGQTATNFTGQVGENAAGAIGENTLQAGNARAARAINQGNAVNNVTNSLGQWYLSQQYNKPPPAESTGSMIYV